MSRFSIAVMLAAALGWAPALVAEQEACENDAGGNKLPVSLNDVMVSLVNHSADPIWVAAWKEPSSERQWRDLERLAYQLEIAGKLLTIPGTGPNDVAWASDPAWQAYSLSLSQIGERAVAAVSSRDKAAISAVGDDLVALCEACHIDFKPAEPTGGKYGELSPTAQDFEDDKAGE